MEHTRIFNKEMWDHYGNSIIGLMINNHAEFFSEEEIIRTLSECVMSQKLTSLSLQALQNGWQTNLECKTQRPFCKFT